MERKQKEFEVGEAYSQEFLNLSDESKKDNLEGLAYSVKNETYTKILSEDELIDRREKLSDVCIDIDIVEVQKKELMDEFKERLKTPKETKAELLTAIRFKSESRTGNLYHIDDQENGFMYIFDEDAVCVESRPLKPTEKQAKIKTFNPNLEANG